VKVLRAAAIANKFVAERRMSDKESTRYDKYTPQNWFQKLPIVPQEETPPASGYGYTQSPYISQWTKMWGVNPLTDLPKYRMMYRTVPIVKKAIDKTVATAISKGFEIDLPPTTEHREDILEYLKSWIDQQEDFKIHLQMLASDALTYGNAYAEIVYDEIEVTEERSTDPEFQRVEIPDPHEDYKIGEHGIPYLPTVNYNGDGKYLKVAAKGNPVWIKPLDPLWMRVRRDSYGNVFGYLQYLSTPPVAFTNDKTIHIRFNPKSWWTENAYGTSMLMSLVRTQEAIWTIENDLILISHACAKPPLVFACGDNTEEPWTEGQFTAFVGATSSRGPGGDIYHRGDVIAKPLPFPASSLAPLLAHLDYHKEQRMISLGVPPDLLGVHASSNRSVATVSFDDWINTIQLLQQQMGDAIQEQLFKPIVEKAFGEGCPVPNMVWNQVYEKDDAAEIQKVMTLRAASIITVNEARAWLGEVGKNFEPVEGGDSLIPPEVQMPIEESSPEMPGEDEILGDSVVEAKASEEPLPNKTSANLLKKGVKKIFGAEEEEYTDIKIKPPKVIEKKKETLEADIQGFAEPGASSGTGIRDTTIYPLLERDGDKRRKVPVYTKKDKKDFLSKIASKLQTMEFAPIRAEQDNLTGQSNDRSDFPEKDLRGVKIEKLEDKDGIEVWLIDSQIAAQRYDPKWAGVGSSKWIGSHHFVFEYVPLNEVWVSDQVPVEGRSKVITHEVTERALMEKGMAYNLAHIEALKTEGNISEAELKERQYISPEEVITTFTRLYPKIKENENHWKVGDKDIVFDKFAGIIYLKDGEKIIDQVLIRGTEDIEKFVTKYMVEKVEL